MTGKSKISGSSVRATAEGIVLPDHSEPQSSAADGPTNPSLEASQRTRVDLERDFVDFYRATAERVWRLTVACLGNLALAQEATQETFLAVWKNWPMIQDPVAYTFATALHTVEKARKQNPHHPSLDGILDVSGSLDNLDQVDIRIDLVAALRELPSRQMEVLALHYLVDLPTRVIGEMLGISAETVCSHLSQGRPRLRAVLAHRSAVRSFAKTQADPARPANKITSGGTP